MKSINKVFAFLLGIGAFGLTLELLRFLSERNGNDHVRAMLGAVALFIGGSVIHIVVLNLFGLIEEDEAEQLDGEGSPNGESAPVMSQESSKEA